MKVLIAPDSFKESLSAPQVTDAIAKGLSSIDTVIKCPLADGGEGSLALLIESYVGQIIRMNTRNAIGQEIAASYGWVSTSKTAIVELAQASGLEQIESAKRDVLRASTFGTGLLIRDAIERGAEEVIITLGGSATNDAGVGIAAALGVQFLGEDDEPFIPAGHDLGDVKRLDFTLSLLDQCRFKVACDVTNPIVGAKGASRVFAPQKGATQEQVEALESQMISFVSWLEGEVNQSLKNVPGLGAAGGAALMLYAISHVELMSGIQLIASHVDLEEKMRSCDVVITGEGKYDEQSRDGKVVSYVQQLAASQEKRCLVICGQSEIDEENVYSLAEHFDLEACFADPKARITQLVKTIPF